MYKHEAQARDTITSVFSQRPSLTRRVTVVLKCLLTDVAGTVVKDIVA